MRRTCESHPRGIQAHVAPPPTLRRVPGACAGSADVGPGRVPRASHRSEPAGTDSRAWASRVLRPGRHPHAPAHHPGEPGDDARAARVGWAQEGSATNWHGPRAGRSRKPARGPPAARDDAPRRPERIRTRFHSRRADSGAPPDPLPKPRSRGLGSRASSTSLVGGRKAPRPRAGRHRLRIPISGRSDLHRLCARRARDHRWYVEYRRVARLAPHTFEPMAGRTLSL